MKLCPLLVPAGNDTEIQYNNGGLFGGDSTFTFNDSTKDVTIGGNLILSAEDKYVGLDATASWVFNTTSDYVTTLANVGIKTATPNNSFQVAGLINFDDTNFNVFLGSDVFNNDGGRANVGIGYRAGYNNDTTGAGNEGDANVYIGYLAGYGATGGTLNSGTQNFGLGHTALYHNTSGHHNCALGARSMYDNTSGLNCVAVGASSLENSTSAQNIVAIGKDSAFNLTTARLCSYIGAGTGKYNRTGWENTVFGALADGYGSAGTYNHARMTVMGTYAGYKNQTGNDGVYIGYKSGYNQTTNSNRFIVDNQDRGSAANEITQCLVYGIFSATSPSGQSFRVNGEILGSYGAKIGDAGVTNYTEIKADGEINLHGMARVTKKIKIGNANLGKGSTAPTQVIEGDFTAWEFTINDDAVLDAVLPEDWCAGTDIVVKVCWYVDDAYSGADEEVRWTCAWSAIPMDFTEAPDAPTHTGDLDSGDIDIDAHTKHMGVSTIGTITAANLSASDMLGFVLKRENLLTAGANPANDPRVHHLVIEYTADKLGIAA